MATNLNAEARRLVENLPENSTWDDLMHEVYVRQAVESGPGDGKSGRTLDVSRVREKYVLR